MREGGHAGEFGEASVEGGNVRTIYLEDVTKYRVEEISTHLVESKHSVVNVPVLHVDLSMRGIRHTINRDLELLGAFLSSFSANLFLVVDHFPRRSCVDLDHKPA